MKKFTYIDLFAGCGGLSEGFESVGGFEMLAAVEWDKAARTTLANRMESFWKIPNAEKIVTRFDIQRTDELFLGWDDDEYGSHEGLDALIGSKPVDLIVGGPPCQAYSIAGRVRDENGMHLDYRNYLFESFIKVVNKYQPKILVFENVPGMLSAKPNGISITCRIKEHFRAAGYVLLPNLGDAQFEVSDYGIPQRRKRVIIFAVSLRHYGGRAETIVANFYKILRNEAGKKCSTVQKAIGHFPKFKPSRRECRLNGRKYSHEPVGKQSVVNHQPRYHNPRDINIFRTLCEDIASKRNKYVSVNALKELYTKETGKTSAVHKYYVLRWKQPSNLIPAHLYKDGLRHIHPDPKQARSITVREAAALQTFPSDYEFLGSMGDQYKMVGNAVPPEFAAHIANAITELESEKPTKGGADAIQQ
jgi:DNA (cytosine-5)-methyltransferase 1